MDFRFATQIQQPKSHPVALVAVLAVAVPKSADRFCFVDSFNNIKVVDSVEGDSKAFSLNKFSTKAPEAAFTTLAEYPVTGRLFLGDSAGRVSWFKVTPKPDNCASFRPHLGRVNCLSFSADGALLATASNDKTVKLFELGKSNDLKKPPSFLASFMHTAHVRKVQLRPFGLFSTDGKTFHGFDIPSKAETLTLESLPRQQFADFHLTDTSVAVLLDERSEFRVLDLRTSEIVRAFSLPNLAIRKSVVSASTFRIALCGESPGLSSRIASVPKLSVIGVFDSSLSPNWEIEPKFAGTDLAFSVDGRTLLVGTKADGLMVFKAPPPLATPKSNKENALESPAQPLICAKTSSASPVLSQPVLGESINKLLASLAGNNQVEIVSADPAQPRASPSQLELVRTTHSVTLTDSHPPNSATMCFEVTSQSKPNCSEVQVPPELLTVLHPEDYLITNSCANQNDKTPLDLNELASFIKQREALLAVPNNDSGFSFKVSTRAPPVSAPKQMVLPEESPEEYPENVFARVLGQSMEGESPIAIIDEHFHA